MLIPPKPANEALRLRALRTTALLDTPSEERFDRLTRLARRILGVPIALVSLIDSDRQWFKSRQGLDACETPRDISFCGHAILDEAILEVPDATLDPRFADNPVVTGAPFVRFYAGAPLRTSDGYRIGTLCVIDSIPHRLNTQERDTLRDLADCVEREINALEETDFHARLATSAQRSSTILGSLPDIVFLVDRNSVCLECNDHPDLLQPREQVLGRRVLDFLPDELAARCRAAIDHSLASGKPDAFEYALEIDGAQRSFEARVHALDANEALILIRNVTRERRAQVESLRQLEAFSVLNEIASTGSLSPDEQLDKALRLATDYLNLEVGVVSRVRDNDYRIRAVVAPPAMKIETGQHFPLDGTYCTITLHSNDLVAIDCMRTSPYSGHPCYREFGLESYIASPLTVSGTLYGTLNFSSRTARTQPFTDNEKMFVRLLARWVTASLERDRASRALRLSEARLRGLFELSPIGIALNDFTTGAFLEVNHALLAPTGYTRDEFIALGYQDVTPPEYAAQEAEILETLNRTGRYGPFEKEYIRKDGSRYPVQLSGMAVFDPSGRKLIWSIIEDISERKRMERMKNEFISVVSHELRTPLTAISGALALVTSGQLGEFSGPVLEMLNIARTNSQQLNLLVNDLLDMEKLAAGKLLFDIRLQPLTPVIEQAVLDNQGYASQFDVQLQFVGEARDAQAAIDSHRLHQVLANLLSNAAKFSPAGERVEVSLSVREHALRISVTDHGPGIPEAFRKHIFQKFSQADASDRRQKGGTGLGLAISRELVERMDGRIGFESVEGQGATFWVEFPAAAGESQRA